MNEMSLGQYLKQLRESHRLGLNEVSRRSYDVSITREGTISPAQLLHIERGGTKRPGLLKLATLADIYRVELASLTAFLDEDMARPVRKGEIEKVNRALGELGKWISMADGLKPTFRKHNLVGAEAAHKHLLKLQQDLLDAIGKANVPLVPACDGQPPMAFRFAQRLLCDTSSDGKTRRTVLRLLLSLHGFDLEDSAAAFIAAAPRSIRSAVIRELPGQARLPTPMTGREDKRSIMAKRPGRKDR